MDQLLALRVFIRIADARSFAKAADSLNIPRSSVSKLLQDLEAHLGTKLVERNTRSFTITPAGEAYREQALNLLADLDGMDSAARDARASPQGTLRVDVGSTIANLVVIPALPTFHTQHPDIALLLGVSDRVTDLIGEGVDCVIRGGDLPDSTLIGRRLCQLDYMTCATPDYLFRYGMPTHPSEIDEKHRTVRYFFPHTGKPLPLYFKNDIENYEIHGRSGLCVSESTALTQALLTGLGICQIFRFIARPHILAGRLVPILEDWIQPSSPIQLVYPSTRHPSATLRAFADWAVNLFKQENSGY